MRRPPIRVLDVGGTPAEMGRAHGAAYADEIRSYTEERVSLVMGGLWTGTPITRSEVLDLAEECLEAHHRQSPAIFEEMEAMAKGAGISMAEAVVVGGFTDFVDTVSARYRTGTPNGLGIEDDCTAFIVPDRRAGGAGFFGQTWDMHASAADYVILLRTKPDEGPGALIFTTTGCLGQIGMNDRGVCAGMTNLTAVDGRVGVTWPMVIRQALATSTAQEARDVIVEADLAGGHNYVVFDAEGEGYNIEAMPSARHVTALGADPITHTNHTLHPDTYALEGARPAQLQASSRRRLAAAAQHLDRSEVTIHDLMDLTRQPVCQTAEPPYFMETVGAAIMRPRTRDFWAVWGLPTLNDYARAEFL